MENQLFWGTFLDDASLVDEHNAICKAKRLVDVMGDKENGLVELAVNALQLVLQLGTGLFVHRTERFIHQDNRRFGSQSTGHPYPLSLPTTELARIAIKMFGFQTHQVNQFKSTSLALLFPNTLQLGNVTDILPDTKMRKQACWMAYPIERRSSSMFQSLSFFP